jgi:hypothetical protein
MEGARRSIAEGTFEAYRSGLAAARDRNRSPDRYDVPGPADGRAL